MASIVARVVDWYVFNLLERTPDFAAQAKQNKIYEHLWQGVAGKIENGEEAWQTAIRELERKPV